MLIFTKQTFDMASLWTISFLESFDIKGCNVDTAWMIIIERHLKATYYTHAYL